MIFIIIILCLLAIYLFFKFVKIPKIKNIVFIDGALGTGKTYYSVALAIKLHKKQLLKWRLKKLLPKYKSLEKPLLYSNIKIKNYDFVVVNKDIIMRTKRINYGSILLLDEFSLILSQTDFNNQVINEACSNFFKLFRHETHGGYMIINSQSISDLHYSLRYVLTDYFYIHSRISYIPFISLLKIQERVYNADSSAVNVVNEDIEDNTRLVLVSKKYFKYYDTYYYSIFTDFLQSKNDITKITNGSLKADEHLTLKKHSTADMRGDLLDDKNK